MQNQYAMVIDDPSKFNLLTDDMRKRFIKAGQNTVNTQAAITRKNAIQNQKGNFNIRNNFTAKNTVFEQCDPNVTSINQIQSEVGATQNAEYMERQELGGYHTNGNKELAIPTNKSRGGSFSNLVQSQYKLKQVLRRKYKPAREKRTYASKKASLVARAFISHKLGLSMSWGKNLFVVDNFTKTGSKITFHMAMIRNFNYIRTYTPPKPWLQPATEKPAQDGQNIFNSQMAKLETQKMI